MNRQDNVDIAGKKWEFDEDVAKCFPDMLKRSIPAYESMRSLVFSIGRNYVKKNTHICDIGCSDMGKLLNLLSNIMEQTTIMSCLM